VACEGHQLRADGDNGAGALKLRERLSGHEVTATLSAEDTRMTLSIAAALATYEVIEATPEEREALQRTGFPFGGVQ